MSSSDHVRYIYHSPDHISDTTEAMWYINKTEALVKGW